MRMGPSTRQDVEVRRGPSLASELALQAAFPTRHPLAPILSAERLTLPYMDRLCQNASLMSTPYCPTSQPKLSITLSAWPEKCDILHYALSACSQLQPTRGATPLLG